LIIIVIAITFSESFKFSSYNHEQTLKGECFSMHASSSPLPLFKVVKLFFFLTNEGGKIS